MHKLLLVFVIVALSVYAPAQAKSASVYVEALLATPNIGHVYYEDGASDGSILNVGIDYSNECTRPIPAVKDIVDLKDAAIPLLISCLDDTRVTSATYQTRLVKSEMPAPLALVCLDVLSSIVADNSRIFVPDCSDDGLGSCYQDGFYFRPDVFAVGSQVGALKQISRVKANWERARQKGWLRFRYPGNWEIYPVQ